MLKYGAPLIEHYNKVKWSTRIPGSVRNVLHNTSKSVLGPQESKVLFTFLRNTERSVELNPHEKSYIIRYLYERRAYKSLIGFGEQLASDPHSRMKLRRDLTINEIAILLKAMVETGSMIQLDSMMKKVIAQFSLARRFRIARLAAGIFANLEKSTPANKKEALFKWAKWMKLLHGHCSFTDYAHQRYFLASLLYFLRQVDGGSSESIALFKDLLEDVKHLQGAAACSQFSTTLIYLFAYARNFVMVEALWNFKLDNGLPLVPSDLTAVLRAYCSLKKFDLVKSTYDAHPEAQHDQTQFDYLLVRHSKLSDWKALQAEFDGLFSVGELPNIKHYGIVMYALAQVGEVESVERLYSQLLKRNMIPSYTVLQALLFAHYKVGDYNGCFRQFELFKKYSVEPSSSSYTIMFKVYKSTNDIEGALRLLRRITEEQKVTIMEQHFAVLMKICSRFTNHLIAQELFSVMVDHYSISPTGISVSALMDVYIESDLPHMALHVFKKYVEDEPIDEGLIAVFTKAITAHLKMRQFQPIEKLLQQVISLGLELDAGFYAIFIKYLVASTKDYEGAEAVLLKLLDPTSQVKANTTHFEVLMSAYDRTGNRGGIFTLYQRMNEANIPPNSKILLYLIKATFRSEISKKQDLDTAIGLVERIMDSTANKTLDLTFSKLHPSVIGWPIRTISKFSSPKRAYELLEKYKAFFFEGGVSGLSSKFVTMRTQLVVFAELEEWQAFGDLFDKYIFTIEKYQKKPSSTVPNKKFRTLLSGLFFYKVRQLVVNGKIRELPGWLDRIRQMDLVLDNDSWNDAVKALFQDTRTIETGINIVNDKMIHGYNLIHKYRLLRRFSGESSATITNSWFLDQKAKKPDSFVPTLYVKSDVLQDLLGSLDSYLNKVQDIETVIGKFAENYAYFMKTYLMKPRADVNGWLDIEAGHAKYFERLRKEKTAAAASRFSAE